MAALTRYRPLAVVHRCWCYLRDLVGHRGAFLLFLSLLDVGLGYGLITSAIQKASHHPIALSLSLAALLHYNTTIPLAAWGGLWLAAGLITGVGGFVKDDRWAYAAACFIKTAWAAMYLDIWLIQGYPYGWLSFLVWLAFAATVLIISSWPEGRARYRGPPEGAP